MTEAPTAVPTATDAHRGDPIPIPRYRRTRPRFALYLSQHHTHLQHSCSCIRVDTGGHDGARSWRLGKP